MMKYQFFSIPVHDAADAQADLNRFCQSHRIVAVEKQCVTTDHGSFWAFCISYLDGPAQKTVAAKPKVDYREVLSGEDFAVFAMLRSLRKELAEADGVPAYAIFTNEQLSEMVVQRTLSNQAMTQIAGVGKGRLEKYGVRFLTLLRQEFRADHGEANAD